MRLVLDTNVVISAFINPSGKPSRIIKLILNRRANTELYYNSTILSEYEGVSLRPKFSAKINSDNVRQFINLIRSIGISFDPVPGNKLLPRADMPRADMPDESDRIFYDTAKGSGSILISGNIKHFPKESFIMLPADFLKKFENELMR